MPLHLIKLSVGSDSVESLAEWQAQRCAIQQSNGQPPYPFHDTRMSPKRSQELLAGGSIYWVIRRKIRCRQAIVALKPHVDEDGKPFCRIVLDPNMVRTELRTKRPFQGWRYLKGDDAPSDLGGGRPSSAETPELLEQALKEACVW